MRQQLDESLFEKLEPTWGPEREAAVRAALARRVTRREGTLRTAVAVGATALIAVGGFALWNHRPARFGTNPLVSTARPAQVAPSADRASEAVAVTQLSPDTVLAPLPERGGRGFALRAGGARFSVPHDAGRPFVVTAGDVTVEDLGTTFTVRFLAADRLKVAVEEGRVRVRGGETDTEVSAGATLEVPIAPVAVPAPKQPRISRTVAPSWRPLAERGQYEEARTALRKAGPSAVRNDTADLLLAADAARLSGHPAEAVPYLERVLHGHNHDPRAGLAAFTLGRVLLDELGRPNEAVDAFAVARSFGGPLAEDALAREVEAASRAGDVTRSRELALLYRRLYPEGRRARAVSRFGGLD
jgi:transmembrane sensor